ncbi:MAG TPA: agmatine deiminase family protein, partial [Acidimicrobiales bacterium]|nr:agmatine deiminase family protein [Acidimicrobiales bacterium]
MEASTLPNPAKDGFRMPPESAEHEATIMAWPCRAELWEDLMTAAKAEFSAVANAIAEFEPVIMVASSPADAGEARAALSRRVEVVQIPLDDSWTRDNGPIFCLDDQGRRAGVHFCFNAWGGKYAGWDRDEQAGGLLAERYGDLVYQAPLVLEGGSVIVDSAGRLVTTEQCLLHPNRNPGLSRADIESVLRDYLGAAGIVWLGRGLVEDRDTDGHVDLIAAFTDSGSLLLQSRPAGDPNHESMAENRGRAQQAGGVLAEWYGDRVYHAPVVLEGGSVIIDSAGRLVTTEQCLLHPNRNPHLSRADIESTLRNYLGAVEIVWLARGLVEDRDTDGHVDLIAAFTDSGSLLLQARPPGDPNHESMAENRDRARQAGLDVVDFAPLARADVGGQAVAHSYLNLYRCNGAAIIPLAGGVNRDADEQALDLLAKAFPRRQVIGVAGLTLAFGGGGPHCITQQIPARRGKA